MGGAGVQMVAVMEDERVVGWCDIVRVPMEGSRRAWLE
jgi:hypothetical protein